jgi:hypothetical protein
MSEMFDDLDGVEVMVSDVLVWGNTQEEHGKRLEEVLERNLKGKSHLLKSCLAVYATEPRHVSLETLLTRIAS